MDIVGIAVIKNEDDVIEAMVRHNLCFVDHLHIVDNGSTDRTGVILHALAQEGLPISYEVNTALSHLQARFLSDLANDTYRNCNLILLDADEFLVGNSDDMHTLFSDPNTPMSLPWVTYLPRQLDNTNDLNPLTRITHRRKKERPQFFKTTVPAAIQRPVEIGAGSHNIKGYSSIPHPTLRLAHFPVRSSVQIASKVLIGSWNMSLRSKGRSEGYQWHQLAAEIRQDGLPTPEALERMALNYASKREVAVTEDPIETNVHKLKYTKSSPDQLLHNICGFVDRVILDRTNK